MSTPEATMLGVDTAYYFKAVLELAFAQQQHFDLLLVTGDLAQEPCNASYQLILRELEAYNIPCICLPGNHDDYDLMQKILNTRTVSCRKQVLLDGWQLICLNSQIPGSPKGYLAKHELAFLEDCLNTQPEHYALITVHHHCVACNSVWMDKMMIENDHELLSIARQYPQAKVISNGHIHQVMDINAGSVRILGTPSTCFQFKPESTGLVLDDLSPGYRTINLYPDGQIETAVNRLPEKLSGLQVATKGY